jgi:hypothetical protein
MTDGRQDISIESGTGKLAALAGLVALGLVVLGLLWLMG